MWSITHRLNISSSNFFRKMAPALGQTSEKHLFLGQAASCDPWMARWKLQTISKILNCVKKINIFSDIDADEKRYVFAKIHNAHSLNGLILQNVLRQFNFFYPPLLADWWLSQVHHQRSVLARCILHALRRIVEEEIHVEWPEVSASISIPFRCSPRLEKRRDDLVIHLPNVQKIRPKIKSFLVLSLSFWFFISHCSHYLNIHFYISPFFF